MGGKQWEAAELSKARNGSVMYVLAKVSNMENLDLTGLVFSLCVPVNLHPNTSTVGGWFGLPHCQI